MQHHEAANVTLSSDFDVEDVLGAFVANIDIVTASAPFPVAVF